MQQPSSEERIRQLEFRLQRLGVLELEAWLAPLLPELRTGNASLIESVEMLLNYEAPVLIAVQQGDMPLPKALEPWLAK